MPKTLVDIDATLLADAAEVLGTRTKKDTVTAALTEIVNRARQLEHLERLRSGGLPDLSDPEVMAQAWR